MMPTHRDQNKNGLKSGQNVFQHKEVEKMNERLKKGASTHNDTTQKKMKWQLV